MNPIYSINNNTCYNNQNGYIIISSIEFSEEEQDLYDSYTILWSGDFDDNSIISQDGLLATNLRNGTYSFKIASLTSNAQSDPYTVEITSPSELKITEVKHSEHSCGNNGYIYVEFSGGVSPYRISIGQQTIATNENNVKFEELQSGEFSVFLTDANNCTYQYPLTVVIKDAFLTYKIESIESPKKYNDYAELSISVTGYGPFSFRFINYDTKDSIYINNFDTKYLISTNQQNSTYIYKFTNLLRPGDYELVIANQYGCEQKISIITLPNIGNTTVSINSNADTSNKLPIIANPQPILDTLLVPYELIKSNSEVWKLLKTKTTKDTLQFIINKNGTATTYNFQIVRNLLNKYFLNNGDIEILRLGDSDKEWFFYFYIAPSINLSDTDLTNSTLQLKINDNIFNVTIGLDVENNLDSYNLSLIMGSFILPGLGYEQFQNGNSINISFEEPVSNSDYTYIINNIQKQSASNLYSVDFVTILNFLEQFNILNKNINISKPEVFDQDYTYNLNIKNLLKNINKFNNIQSIYLYNPTYISSNGSLFLSISGNDIFGNSYDNYETNSYSIDYYFISETSQYLQSIYAGSNLVKNTNNINNIPNGFYVIRVKDKYDNIPQAIKYNNIEINYEQHFLAAKKIIQAYNSSVLSYFNYGDILVNIDPEIAIDNIPGSYVDISETLPDKSITAKFYFIQQPIDDSNIASLYIELLNSNITCYLYGPKNYSKKFTNSSRFTNLIPGIYTIIGDEQELKQNSLYQNEIRVILEKGYEKEVFLSFVSYNNLISIKENN